MKQLTIIALILVASITALAQTNNPITPPPAAPAKPKFSLDLNQIATITMNSKFKGSVLNDFFIFSNNGPDKIAAATDISSGRATEIRRNYQAVLDSVTASINRAWGNYYSVQQLKFTADTLARYHPATVKKGGKQ